MYAVCVTFHIRPDAFDKFLKRMHQQADDSLSKEEGCHRFDVCDDGGLSSAIFLYELYEDRRAFELHSESEHFLAFDAEVSGWTLKKEVSTFENVRPGGP
jgi:quinol monooxygenase YgiN